MNNDKVLKCSSYNIQTMLPSFLYNFSQVYILTWNISKVPNLKLKLFPALIWTAQSSSGYSTYLSIKFLSMQYWLLFFFISGSYQLRSRREWALLTVKYEIKWPAVAHSQTYQKRGRDGTGPGQPTHLQVVITISLSHYQPTNQHYYSRLAGSFHQVKDCRCSKS